MDLGVAFIRLALDVLDQLTRPGSQDCKRGGGEEEGEIEQMVIGLTAGRRHGGAGVEAEQEDRIGGGSRRGTSEVTVSAVVRVRREGYRCQCDAGSRVSCVVENKEAVRVAVVLSVVP